MIEIVHCVEHISIKDEKALEKMQQRLNQMWSEEYQQQMKKMAQKSMQERRRVKVQVLEQPKMKIEE